ncbi:MAG TPA: hypothetical protein VLT82_00580 [Myxococcaceae bacterium]|nr:hypothetical protein [Myxococcaceae bacterium]
MPRAMRENEMPVTVSVTRADGTVEQVQVGTAVRRGDGFSVRLTELTIGGEGGVRAAPSRRAPSGSPGEPPTVFPPYGRSRGMPIQGANAQDLEFYATGARRTLADPGKARFHDKERALLAAIEAEQARQGGEGGTGEEPPPPEEEQF